MLRQCTTCRHTDFRLNLKPRRARRLSEAGRHWAPIARQKATRKERQAGRMWPTYCYKSRSAPPGIDGLVHTVAWRDSRCKREDEFRTQHFPNARGWPQYQTIGRELIHRHRYFGVRPQLTLRTAVTA